MSVQHERFLPHKYGPLVRTMTVPGQHNLLPGYHTSKYFSSLPGSVNLHVAILSSTFRFCLRPHFRIWPDKRNHTVLLTLAHISSYSLQHRTSITLQDYLDFLFLSRWKLLTNRSGRDRVGNNLAVLKPQETRNQFPKMRTTIRVWPVK